LLAQNLSDQQVRSDVTIISTTIIKLRLFSMCENMNNCL
jgi:hypothetical protein